jgi:hypothetical protein
MSQGFDGTTITRAGSRDRFTVVHNRTIEDDRLSFRALGLLVFVLSKPDNWKTHVNHLATTHSEGRGAVRSALGELEEFGYVERKWMRADGEATPSMHYLVSELPACPEIGNPENWEPGNRDAQKPATSKEGSKEVVKTDSQQTLAKGRKSRIPDPFVVTAKMQEWATEKFPAVDWRAQTEQFKDHHQGNGNTKLDWEATWRTWIRNAGTRFAPRQTNGTPRLSNVEKSWRNIQEALG